MIVVDASVAAKWYLNEAGSDAAAQLLEHHELLYAPGLIRVEVPAAITRQHRLGHLAEHRAREACELWRINLAAGIVKLIPDELLVEPAKELAFRLRHALQDCLYLATSAQLDARLVTADEPFHKRAGKHFSTVDFLEGCKSN